MAKFVLSLRDVGLLALWLFLCFATVCVALAVAGTALRPLWWVLGPAQRAARRDQAAV